MTQSDSNHTQTAAPATSAPPKVDSFEVGWLFVQEYYTFLNKDPKKLHQFYNRKSYFLHGQEGESAKLCHGQADIYEHIMKLGFVDCKVLISNVDSQSSLDGGIIVQVLGELSNNGLPCHKFAQTFFLAEQPTGYYVLNDIFRFLKEDIDNDYEVTTEPAAEPIIRDFVLDVPPSYEEAPEPIVEAPALIPSPPKEEPATEPKIPAPVKEQVAPAVPEVKKVEDVTERKVEVSVSNGVQSQATPAPAQKKPVPQTQPSAPAAAPSKPQAPPAEQQPKPQLQPARRKSLTKSAEPESEPESHSSSKPTTWAGMAAASAKEAWGSQTSPTKTSNPVPQVKKDSPAKPPSSPIPSEKNVDLVVESASGDESGKDQFQTIQSKTRQNRNSYYANGSGELDRNFHSIYVANIPSEVTNQELRSMFGKAGLITKVDYVKSKNIAFIDFETAEILQRALALPHTIHGLKLHVEERRKHRNTNYRENGGYYNNGGGYRNNRGGSTAGGKGRGAPGPVGGAGIKDQVKHAEQRPPRPGSVAGKPNGQ